MDFKLSAQGVAWGFVNKLNLIKLSRFLPSTLQTESPSIFLGREEEGTSADILDNSYWACSKFNFFCDVNQTVTVASTLLGGKINEQKLQM